MKENHHKISLLPGYHNVVYLPRFDTSYFAYGTCITTRCVYNKTIILTVYLFIIHGNDEIRYSGDEDNWFNEFTTPDS